jgi:hypothetical protein
MPDPIKVKASELLEVIDAGDPFESVDDAITDAVQKMTHGSGDVTVSVIIENDLEAEDEESEDEEDDSE